VPSESDVDDFDDVDERHLEDEVESGVHKTFLWKL
jgi:hypothetical protein